MVPQLPDVASLDLVEVLREQFGCPAFRPGQQEAVLATLQGHDSLVILPTGAGKSLTFQFPPFTRPHAFTVVVSPLLALARDQVQQAKERGIDARSWNSEVAEGAKASILAQIACPEVDMRLLYTTPESLRHETLRSALQEAYALGTLMSFAVDEAHCVSEWGHDFRLAYLELASLKADFPKTPMACLTASCTARVQGSIVSVLGLKNAKVIKASFNRPNIQYQVTYKDLIGDGSEAAVMQDLVQFIKQREGQSGIIYARLRATCDAIGKALEMEDVDVAVYHAGKDNQRRNRVQSDWSEGALQVVVATVAFGMGVDKPDVRWVVHYNAPCSMEGMYQESGRAGRDGQPCTSVVYVSQSDLEAMARMERGARTGSVSEVSNLLMAAHCRRKRLLAFFGESRSGCDVSAGEQLCDFCSDRAAVTKALGLVARARERNLAAAAAPRPEDSQTAGGQSAGSKRPAASAWATGRGNTLSVPADSIEDEEAPVAAAAAQPLQTRPAGPPQPLLRPMLKRTLGLKRALADPGTGAGDAPSLGEQQQGQQGGGMEAGEVGAAAAQTPACSASVVAPAPVLHRPEIRKRSAPLRPFSAAAAAWPVGHIGGACGGGSDDDPISDGEVVDRPGGSGSGGSGGGSAGRAEAATTGHVAVPDHTLQGAENVPLSAGGAPAIMSPKYGPYKVSGLTKRSFTPPLKP